MLRRHRVDQPDVLIDWVEHDASAGRGGGVDHQYDRIGIVTAADLARQLNGAGQVDVLPTRRMETVTQDGRDRAAGGAVIEQLGWFASGVGDTVGDRMPIPCPDAPVGDLEPTA
jgi:hypothetical protein